MVAAAARCPDIRLVRRVITRPTETGGEDFVGVSPEVFQQMQADDAFVLTWVAHGLSYGIPRSIHADLAQGKTVLFNGSRRMLADAKASFANLRILSITAAPSVLAQRLAQRGRETPSEIEKRLERAARYRLDQDPTITQIRNDGPLEDAVNALVACLLKEPI